MMQKWTTYAIFAAAHLCAFVAADGDDSCGAHVELPFGTDPWSFVGKCSNQGICNETSGLCMCKTGWTGRCDFINTEGLDCQIFNPAIQALWGVFILVTVISSIKTIPNVRMRISQFKEVKQQQNQQGNHYPFYKNRGLLAIVLYNFVCLPGGLLFAILRISDSSQRVGLSIPATILFAITRFGFYSMVAAFQPALLASVLQGSKKNRSLVRRLINLANLFAAINLFLSTACGFIPFVTLSDDEELTPRGVKVYVAYMITMLFTLVFYGTQASILLKRSNKLLDKSYELTKDARVLEIKGAITRIQVEAIRQSIVQFIVYSVFLFFPFMYNKHDYFLPIGWLAYPLVGKKIAMTAVVNSTNLSSSGKTSDKTGTSKTAKTKKLGQFKTVDNTSKDAELSELGSFQTPSFAVSSPIAKNFSKDEPQMDTPDSFKLDRRNRDDVTKSAQFRNGVSTFYDDENDEKSQSESENDLV